MADDSVAARDARRVARARWPIVRVGPGEEQLDDLSETTTPTERIAMMWQLAEEAWRVAGRALPSYARTRLPARLYRPGEARPDDDDA
jgi:hypothetical protein